MNITEENTDDLSFLKHEGWYLLPIAHYNKDDIMEMERFVEYALAVYWVKLIYKLIEGWIIISNKEFVKEILKIK